MYIDNDHCRQYQQSYNSRDVISNSRSVYELINYIQVINMYIPNFVDRKAEKRKTYPKFRIVNMNWRMIYACDMIHLRYDTSKGHSYTFRSTAHVPKHKMKFLKKKN